MVSNVIPAIYHNAYRKWMRYIWIIGKTAFVDYRLKYCFLRQDSKTRLQEEVNQKKRFSFLMSTPTTLQYEASGNLMIIG